ncbi:MAG: epoxyqueuosine reductase, partial [Candidatus Methylomirabilota bacterium]
MDKKSLQEHVRLVVARHESPPPGTTIWRTPLVGFSAADDPLFADLKRVVSGTHALPRELLPSARTVIAYFIPFAESVPESNRGGYLASREWAQSYLRTNALIRSLGEQLQALLRSEGHDAVAPPATHNFDERRLVSDWSHRHVAFIAGLGTFGANNMLITEAGCCGRLGSLVTSLPVAADARSGEENCLHRANGSCLQCVGRCVGAALFPDRFERQHCYRVCKENEAAHQALGKADVCGKCLVGLPCSRTN